MTTIKQTFDIWHLNTTVREVWENLAQKGLGVEVITHLLPILTQSTWVCHLTFKRHLYLGSKSYLCIRNTKLPGCDLIWSVFRQNLYSDVAMLDLRAFCGPVLWITLKRSNKKKKRHNDDDPVKKFYLFDDFQYCWYDPKETGPCILIWRVLREKKPIQFGLFVDFRFQIQFFIVVHHFQYYLQ